MIKTSDVAAFRRIIRHYYKKHKRDFPWRETSDPYRILVSEIMLQQTQVDRVVSKYTSFLKKWPTVKKLAQADLRDVLAEWSGLGYNRRGKSLWLLAKVVVSDFRNRIPNTPEDLDSLPGIGPYTSRAVMAFAYNTPHALIETNIRTVFVHSFFPNTKRKISDAELFPFIERTLDRTQPREWYYALMDYGAYLKKTKKGSNANHAVYTKQKAFKGSLREARGAIMRELIIAPCTLRKLQDKIKLPAERIGHAVEALKKDEIIMKNGTIYSISD